MTLTTDDTELTRRLRAHVEAARPTTVRAPYVVDRAMVGMWADAFGDRDPVYTDDAAAIASGRDGVIAPPTMVQAWIMPTLPALARTMPRVPGYAPYVDPAAADDAAAAPTDNAVAAVHRMLSAAGYTARAATHARQEHHRESRPGDRVTCSTVLSSVSPLKRTALGPGYFVTTRMTFEDDHPGTLATQDWTVLCFAADTGGAGARGGSGASGAAPRGVPDGTGTVVAAEPAAPRRLGASIGAARVGDRLPEVTIALTPTFVIATAFATRDFYTAHHDVDWARADLGRPGIFVNILTTTGLVGGLVTDWGGPATRLRTLDLRLFVPAHAGDTLTLSGEVVAVEDGEVDVLVVGRTALGEHVRATVRAGGLSAA